MGQVQNGRLYIILYVHVEHLCTLCSVELCVKKKTNEEKNESRKKNQIEISRSVFNFEEDYHKFNCRFYGEIAKTICLCMLCISAVVSLELLLYLTYRQLF